MKSIYAIRGVIPLLLSQAQVAFNDNAVKLVLIALAPLILAEQEAARVVSLVAAVLVAPYVLFAPLVGWINDQFSKKHVVQASLAMQMGVMGILLVSLWVQSMGGVLAVFFLLGLQSCLMSPAKRGLSGELVGVRRIGEVMGILEMLVVGGILIGSLAGGFLLKTGMEMTGDAWQSARGSVAILSVGCVLAWVIFRGVPSQPAPSKQPFKGGVLFGHFTQMGDLWRHPVVFKAALGDSTFYFLGGVLVLVLAQAGRELYPGDVRAGWVTSLMSAALGTGVILGALTAAGICRDRIHTGLIPLGAMGMAVSFVLQAVVPMDSIFSYAVLAGTGFAAGWFLIPLSGLMVACSPEKRRGELLAAGNLMSSLAGVLAVGAQALMGQVLNIPVWGQFLVLSLIVFVAGIYLVQLLPDELIRLFGLGVAAMHYRVHVRGREAFPKNGGVLLLSNHVSYVDALILSLACPRPVRFLSLESLFHQPVIGWVLKIFGAIPISPRHAREAIGKAAEKIQEGEVVCIFPEGQLTRTGSLSDVKSGFELIARRAECSVVVAHLDGLWGSLFSFERKKFFWKWPRRLRLHLEVRLVEPMTADEVNRQKVVGLWETLSHGGRDEAVKAMECAAISKGSAAS